MMTHKQKKRTTKIASHRSAEEQVISNEASKKGEGHGIESEDWVIIMILEFYFFPFLERKRRKKKTERGKKADGNRTTKMDQMASYCP